MSKILIVDDDPHIRELAGMHEDLMARSGLYARLSTMQFRDPEEELAALRPAAAADKREEGKARPEPRGGLLEMLRGTD